MEDSISDHVDYAAWITRLATGPEPFALSVLVLSGFIRVVTNPRVFDPPSTLDQSFAFVSALVERPAARIVGPGPDHLAILERLCRESGATGKLIADAQHAAVAIEPGCTMVSVPVGSGAEIGRGWDADHDEGLGMVSWAGFNVVGRPPGVSVQVSLGRAGDPEASGPLP